MSYYDRKTNGFLYTEEQTLAAEQLPSLMPKKIKFLNLGELLHYYSEPTEWSEVRAEMMRLRQAAGRLMVYDALWQQWRENDKELTLSGGRVEYTIRSVQGVMLPRGGGSLIAAPGVAYSSPRSVPVAVRPPRKMLMLMSIVSVRARSKS